MKRLILDKETTLNLLNMCTSPDKENWFIALKAINELNLKASLGFIFVLYKFSKLPTSIWIECPRVYKILNNVEIVDSDIKTPITSRILNIMVAQKCSIESVAMFLELHNNSILKNLKSWGYDTNDLKINIDFSLKLKIKN